MLSRITSKAAHSYRFPSFQPGKTLSGALLDKKRLNFTKIHPDLFKWPHCRFLSSLSIKSKIPTNYTEIKAKKKVLRGETGALELLDSLVDIKAGHKRALAKWVRRDGMDLPYLASFEASAAVAREHGLPERPFIALVLNAKESMSSEGTKEALALLKELNLGYAAYLLRQWILNSFASLPGLARKTASDEEAAALGLPATPFVAFLLEVKERNASEGTKAALALLKELNLGYAAYLLRQWILNSSESLTGLARKTASDEEAAALGLPATLFVAFLLEVKERNASEGTKAALALLKELNLGYDSYLLRQWILNSFASLPGLARKTASEEEAAALGLPATSYVAFLLEVKERNASEGTKAALALLKELNLVGNDAYLLRQWILNSSLQVRSLATTDPNGALLKKLKLSSLEPLLRLIEKAYITFADVASRYRVPQEFKKVAWIERGTQVEDAVKRIIGWAKKFAERSISIRDGGYIRISGASGTGKTRMAYEIGQRVMRKLPAQGLGNYIEARSVYLSLAESRYPTLEANTLLQDGRPMLSQKDEELALGWLAERLFASYSSLRHLPSYFYFLALDSDGKMSEVLKLIHRAENIPHDKRLFLLVVIDEYQYNYPLMCHLTRAYGRRYKGPTYQATKVQINLILSGTWNDPEMEFSCDFIGHSIVLSGFQTLSQASDLFDKIWNFQMEALTPSTEALTPSTQNPLTQNTQHQKVLVLLGFIPRFIDLYCNHVLADFPNLRLPPDREFGKYFQDVYKVISEAYGVLGGKLSFPDMSELHKRHLLVLWFFRLRVGLDYRINGHLIRETTGRTTFFLEYAAGSKFYIMLPLAYGLQLNGRLFDHYILASLAQLSETGLPLFVMRILNIRYHLLNFLPGITNFLSENNIPLPGPGVPFETSVSGDRVLTNLATLYGGGAAGKQSVLLELRPTPKPLVLFAKDFTESTLWMTETNSNIFLTAPRFSGPDIVTPHGGVLVKGIGPSSKPTFLRASDLILETFKPKPDGPLVIVSQKKVHGLFFESDGTPVLALTRKQMRNTGKFSELLEGQLGVSIKEELSLTDACHDHDTWNQKLAHACDELRAALKLSSQDELFDLATKLTSLNLETVTSLIKDDLEGWKRKLDSFMKSIENEPIKSQAYNNQLFFLRRPDLVFVCGGRSMKKFGGGLFISDSEIPPNVSRDNAITNNGSFYGDTRCRLCRQPDHTESECPSKIKT